MDDNHRLQRRAPRHLSGSRQMLAKMLRMVDSGSPSSAELSAEFKFADTASSKHRCPETVRT